MVLIYPYFEPHIEILEFIWIPEILFAMAVFLPGSVYIVLMLLMGIPGGIFFSYGYSKEIMLTIHMTIFPFCAVAVPYYFFFTFVSCLLCCNFILAEKREKNIQSLQMLNKQLNKINDSVSEKIFRLQNETTIEERKRISKEIHNTAGYVFINLIMMLQAASAVFYKDTKKAETLINDARNYAERGINEIRHILRNIRDYTPVKISLQNEINNIALAFNKATEVNININYGNWPGSISDNIDSFFLSFMQESLTNALKHGHASSISISCWHKENLYTMTIIDNGSGAALPIKKGIGITALEDFVSRYNGDVRIRSDITGFSIQVSFPIVLKLL
jgi:signal transduction histidine kinase